MSVEINGEKFFTKETTTIQACEVVKCPDCEFEFASKHEQANYKGLYKCPNCAEEKLHHENNKLKGVLEDIYKMSSVGMNKEYVGKWYDEYAKDILNGAFGKVDRGNRM